MRSHAAMPSSKAMGQRVIGRTRQRPRRPPGYDERRAAHSLVWSPRSPMGTAFTRRTTLTGFAAVGATACAAGARVPTRPKEESPMVTPVLEGAHTPVPLPFRPAALRGLSEALIVSHHENNYGGAVRNLNKVEQELARIGKDTPPFVVAALRERELTFRNSKSLHEAYFANLGGDGKRTGAIEAALAAAYGTSARWEEHFRATAAGLGGGSGWVLLVHELDTDALRTIGSGHHTQVQASAVPLLVLDMYEHAYHIDNGAAAAKYIDAFFANVRWEEVDERFGKALKAAALLGS
jgi:Fe-Mn family superoxide dismutase